MGSEVLTKKRTKASHKASATRIVGQIADIVKSEESDISALTLLCLRLKEKYETIKTLDMEIINLIDNETDLTDEIERADGYKEGIFSALIKADQLLDTPATTSIAARGTPTATATPAERTKSMRLPKLQLRHFNGDLTK